MSRAMSRLYRLPPGFSVNECSKIVWGLMFFKLVIKPDWNQYVWTLWQSSADPLKCLWRSTCSLAQLSLCRQMKGRASTCRSNTWKPDDGSGKTLSEAHYKLRKAKSLVKHAPFIITAITPLWLWPPCLNQRETINVEDSLETVQPAGIMHYGAAFTQKCMLMMSCSEREVTGGKPNYADDGVWGRGGGEGEIEDTVAFNIQALVKSSPIHFTAWIHELMGKITLAIVFEMFSKRFVVKATPALWELFSLSSFRCSSAPTADPNILFLLLLLLIIMRPNLDPLGRLAVTTAPSPRRPPKACCAWPGGTLGSVRGRRGLRCPGWVRRRSGRPSAHTGALPVSNHQRLHFLLRAEYDVTTQQEMYSGQILGLKCLILQESHRRRAVCDPIRNVLRFGTKSWVEINTEHLAFLKQSIRS